MSAQRASAPVRFARGAAAVALAALAVAIAVRLADRPGKPSASAVAPPPSAGPVTLQTNIRHEEYKDGRLVAVVSGDTFSVGADGRNRLKGGVDVVNHGPAGQETSRLTADEVAYDKETLVFEIAGRVRIEAGGIVLEGEAFSYDKGKGLFGTAAGGRFSSKTLSGGAPEISYDEAADEVRLGGGFAAELAAAGGADDRLALTGRSFRYARRGRAGRIDERGSIRGADFHAAAGTVSFVASADEAGLDSAVLEDGASVVLGGQGSSAGGEVRADRIEVTFSREPFGLGIAASGHTVLALRSGADRTETVASPAALVSFGRRDGSLTWSAKGGVRAEIAEIGGPGRTLEGEDAWFDGGDILHVSGTADRPAVADSAEARIEARSIAVAAASGATRAAGGVTGVLKKGDGRRRTGFFARGEDVPVSCGTLETRPDISTVLLTGNVLVSRGSDAVRARELELAGDEGRMSGGGGVSITLAEAGSDGRPGRTIELGGQDMAYRPDTRTITLTTKAAIRLPEARLEAGSISAVVARDGRTLETLEARTAVVVSRGRFSGRAEAASYDAAAGRITLTGKPVLTDDQGGSARGAKLTFDLADDKILIENEGPGRATTIIRS
jgi:lipopolysaccharide export system protein LptA